MIDTCLLEKLDVMLAVARLGPADAIPDWAAIASSDFVSITRTSDELSIVCDAASVPSGVRAERGWVALKVAGPLAFDQTGVLASLSTVLANAEVPIFVISSYDTDYILIRDGDTSTATAALKAAGHTVR